MASEDVMGETGGRGWAKIGALVAAGVGVAAAGAAGWFYLREKRTGQAGYAVQDADGAFELRRYPALLTASTFKAAGREAALGDGFGTLADYIFAESRAGPTIAMTAPVFAAPETGGWRVRFVMPGGWTQATLPAPTPGVEIGELPDRTLATIRFAGRADDRLLAEKEAELRAWIAARDLAIAGPVEHAFYNSPFIPGPLRHNEVLFPVREIPKAPDVGTR